MINAKPTQLHGIKPISDAISLEIFSIAVCCVNNSYCWTRGYVSILP